MKTDWLELEYSRVRRGGELEWDKIDGIVPLGKEARRMLEERDTAFMVGVEYGYLLGLRLAMERGRWEDE